jgi:hypothetical protein
MVLEDELYNGYILLGGYTLPWWLLGSLVITQFVGGCTVPW